MNLYIIHKEICIYRYSNKMTDLENTNIVYHIKYKNMINHYNNLKIMNIENEELKNTIDEMKKKLEESTKPKKGGNPIIPAEITSNFCRKPWIRLPYPIREVKLIEYITEKKYDKIEKDKLLKLLYEKKLTSKIVTYNIEVGKIEDITLDT